MGPVLLRADNWTPPARTPWGGRRIVERYKAGLTVDPARAGWSVVGESWELSFDETFPSRLAGGDGRRLDEVIGDDPEAWLGADPTRAARARALLVKLLDAREVLSVQVHPRDDDPALGPDESGKPEAWVVLERAPGAGLWLGLAAGVTRDDFASAIGTCRETGDNERIRALLAFAPVEVGDVFVIDAGTVHAIGPGVTLLEPQIVRPGKRGVTYRFWDWARRFDAGGRPDPGGSPRALNLERSLAVTRWDGPRGAAFHTECRRVPTTLRAAGGAIHEHLFDFHEMRLERVRGDGRLTLPATGAFRAITVVAGRVGIAGLELRHGQTAAIPAATSALDLRLVDADGFLIDPLA